MKICVTIRGDNDGVYPILPAAAPEETRPNTVLLVSVWGSRPAENSSNKNTY